MKVILCFVSLATWLFAHSAVQPTVSPLPASGLYGTMLVTVNGQPVDSDIFTLNSEGVLALVESDISFTKRKPLPFRVVLLRHDNVVKQWETENAADTYSFDLNRVWPHARFGDELVIESAMPAQPSVRRVLKLRRINLNLLLWPNEGC